LIISKSWNLEFKETVDFYTVGKFIESTRSNFYFLKVFEEFIFRSNSGKTVKKF